MNGVRMTMARVGAAVVLLAGGLAAFPAAAHAATGSEISIGDVSIVEGNTSTRTAKFPVTLSEPAATAVTVRYSTDNGTARSSDYKPKSTKLSIKAGKVSALATVVVYGDRVVEPNETFFVELSLATGATLGRDVGTGTILNDDIPPPPGAPSIDGAAPGSPSASTSPALFGTADGGSMVSIFGNGSCSGAAIASDTAAVFGGSGIGVSVLPNSTRTFSATATNGGGTSGCSAPFAYTNVTPPNAPSILGSYPSTPSSQAQPAVYGSAPAGTTVSIFTNGTCAGAAAASGTSAAFSGMGILVSVATDASTSFSANATGIGGTSACSTAYTYTHVSPPAAPTIQASSPLSPSSNLAPSLIGAAAAGSTVAIFASPDCTGPTVATGTSSAFAGSGLGVTASIGTNTYSATAANAGGPSPCSNAFQFVGLAPTYVEVEPNSTPPIADGLTSSIPTDFERVSGNFGGSDIDYFKFVVPSAATVRISVAPTAGCGGTAVLLNLVDSAFATIGNDTSGANHCATVVRPLAAGSYYVMTANFPGAANSPYLLSRTVENVGTEVEPNDTAATATNLSGSDVVVAGDHTVVTDADYYAVTVPAGGSIRAEVFEGDATTCDSNQADSFLRVYAPDGTGLVAQDDDSGRGFCAQLGGTPALTGLAAGTYYVQVTSSSAAVPPADSFRYQLHVTVG